MKCSRTVWFKIAVLLLFAYVLGKAPSVLLPVILSIVLAFILNPVVNFFCRLPFKKNMPRSAAIILSFIIAVFCIIAVGMFILMPFIYEFNKFIINLPAIMEKWQNLSVVIQQQFSTLEFSSRIHELINKGIAEATALSVEIVRKLFSALYGFATGIIELIVVPVLTFYLLKDHTTILNGVIGLFPVTVRKTVDDIFTELGLVISAYIRGQLLVSVIIGLLVFTGIYFLGVEYPLVLGLLATVTELIPIIGPIIGAVPAIILAYLISPMLALKVTVFYIIVHQIENHVVVPNVMGQTINVHPVYLIISLLIGGQLLGIVGMILAVPVAAMLRVLFKYLW